MTLFQRRKAGQPMAFLPGQPVAGSYALIKQELAARHSDDEDAYYAVKDPVCDLIMDAAERWATATDWDRTKGA